MRVPQDLSFVSFDDFDVATLLDPAITTVGREPVKEGALAMSLLAQRLEGENVEAARRCVLETRLSVRDSCASPQGADEETHEPTQSPIVEVA